VSYAGAATPLQQHIFNRRLYKQVGISGWAYQSDRANCPGA